MCGLLRGVKGRGRKKVKRRKRSEEEEGGSFKKCGRLREVKRLRR